MRNSDCYIRFHCIVCNSCISSFDFFYCVLVNAFLAFLEFKFRDLTLPAASFLTVSTTLPAASFNSNVNSLALSSRPSKRLVKLNPTSTGTLLTRFSVGTFRCFNLLSCWVVVVNNLSSCIFNIYTTRNSVFNSGWDIKFIVTTKGKLSCVDNLSVCSITK